jgi:LIVCS family branched-chain amino acid:cation transporter
MLHFRAVITASLAMFAMFFGSGNIVFPLMVGVKSSDQYIYAGLGLLITGVLVPFLGLFSMVIFHGDKDKYFGLLGKYAPFVLSLLILSLIGPFGVVPRCILVSFGGVSLVFPHLPLYAFSGVFITLIYFILCKKSNVVNIIGKYLGPLKIAGIILIIYNAVKQSPQLIANLNTQNPFFIGINEGYQTMDLMATFFFSITIVDYLKKIAKNKNETLKISLLSCFIGALLITAIYLCFIYLGAHYAGDLRGIKPEQYLATIAQITLGEYATYIVAATIFLSCLVTAASLIRVSAEFLRKDIAKEKLSWNTSIVITLIISFILSLTGFDAIVALLGSVLVYAYPALISLTIASILHQFYNFKWVKEVFWLTLIIAAVYKHTIAIY